MLKIIALACALLGLLSAVSIESWLRRHIGNKELASEVYSVTLEKYSEFCLSGLISTALILIAAGLGLGLVIKSDTRALIAYAGGALATLAAVYIGTRSYSSSVVSSSSIAGDGDIKAALRSSYRGGAVIGLIVAIIGVAALGFLELFLNKDDISDAAAALALGATIAGISIRLRGAVLTSAHKLADTDEHNVDYTGAFASNAADFMETLILSGCAAILLAEVGVEDSGIMGTFTITTAARVPLIIMATGIVASVIGIFAFRALTGKYAHFGATAGNILAGILVFASSIYFSITSLGIPSYSFCVGFGVLAQLISGEFCKIYSMDGEIFSRNLPRTRDEDIDIPMLHGLSTGLIAAVVPGLLTTAAIVLSFSIAKYYGVALAAVGACSLTGVNLALREYATTTSASCSFAETADAKLEDNRGYYNILKRASSKAKASGRAYSSVSAGITLTAVLMSLVIKADKVNVNLGEPVVFAGMIIGTILILVTMGLLIRSIISSTSLMLEPSSDNTDDYRNISSVRGVVLLEILAILSPVIVGELMGIDFVIGFIGTSIITGMALVYAFNNTGRYYDRIASDALTTIIKVLVAVALAFIPAFMQFGGFSF